MTSDRRGLDDLKKGDVVLVNITISDTTPMKGTADLNELKEEAVDENGEPIPAAAGQLTAGTCKRVTAGIYQCTWSVSIGTEGFKEVVVPIIVEDAAGQQDTEELTFTVKETTDVATNMWTMRTEQSPDRVNKRLLIYYPKRIYSHIKLSSIIPDARVASATLQKCNPIQAEGDAENEGRSLPTLTPEIVTMSEDKKDILVYVHIPEGSYNTNTLQWACNVSLVSTTSTQFFKTPEIETYDLTVTVDESKLMSDKVDDEIKDIEDYLNGKGPETLRKIDAIITKITGYCGIMRSLNVVSVAAAGAEQVTPPPFDRIPMGVSKVSNFASS
jgi:hypothetical protein